MAGILEKITNLLMPMEEIEEVVEQPVERVAAQETKKVVNGAPLSYETAVQRPVLTVHTTKIPELKMEVYVPTAFEQANQIADALKAKKAAVVNYEKVAEADQRRLCDFINGVCYVQNGEVKRISETMVLYVPETVEIGKTICARGAKA